MGFGFLTFYPADTDLFDIDLPKGCVHFEEYGHFFK